MIYVEVAYARPNEPILVACRVESGATIRQIIWHSGILSYCPEIDLEGCSVGIFSCKASLEDGVKSGDRIEIYRPLTIDPKEARRLRVERSRRSF